MEEIVVKNDSPKRDRSICVMMAVLSGFASLVMTGFSGFLTFLGNYWFIAIAVYFFLDFLYIMWPVFKKDDYNAMRLQGIFQVVSVLVFMPYLLFMILWNDPYHVMDYSLLTFLSLGLVALFKALIFSINRLLIKEQYHPILHAYSNNGLISALFVITIIELILVNMFYPGESTAIFENLLKEKPIWIYIIDIVFNGTLTIFAALLALSTIVRADTKEELTTTNKIKHTIKWFNDHEVSMFIGLVFTLFLAVLSLINMKQSFFYILLFVYYVGNALIRIINYLWHKKIKEKCGDNQIKENRLSSWILLFDAFTYLLFSNVLVVASIFMMIQKANAGTNIYLFLFLIVPMAAYRLVTSNKNIRKNRQENNTYRLGVALIGLVNVFFTLLEVVAITFHGIPLVWLRYIFIILAIIAVKIAVIVVAIIFVIHWLRSIILNRRSKEKKLAKEKGM